MPDTTRIIDELRQRMRLGDTDIRSFIAGVADGEVTDAQLGAFTMAVRLNGMSDEEQTSLTLAMRDSGTVLEWPGLDGPVLDKHSTGGVGDWVSLVLAPMLAAAGAYVPMISGRGLGHTGGTLDKLESVPGFKTRMDLDELRRLVRANGLAMVGQGPELAPADGRTYAVRDVCGTVASIPLIVSSILSKKLAEGLDALVLDVKTGNGATISDPGESRVLAQNLCSTAQLAGISCRALLTDMNEPLGRNVGNALEVREAIDFIAGGHQSPRMTDVVMALSAQMLVAGELAPDLEHAAALLQELLSGGQAAEKFATMIHAQGGPSDLLDTPDRYFEPAPVQQPLLAARGGWLASVDTKSIGMAVLRLGGGRVSVKDNIDPRVGVSGFAFVGDRIEAGQPLCMIHAADETAWLEAESLIQTALCIEPEEAGRLQVIYETIQ